MKCTYVCTHACAHTLIHTHRHIQFIFCLNICKAELFCTHLLFPSFHFSFQWLHVCYEGNSVWRARCFNWLLLQLTARLQRKTSFITTCTYDTILIFACTILLPYRNRRLKFKHYYRCQQPHSTVWRLTSGTPVMQRAPQNTRHIIHVAAI
jgi:hypothetical protein